MKLRCCLGNSTVVRFRTLSSTRKLCFYTCAKDRTPLLSKSNVVYEFTCPCCHASYIGKTERTLFERTKEHATNKESAIFQHFNNCANFQHLLGLFNLSDNNVNTKVFQLTTVRENTRVIDTDSNWNILLFKEAYYIKNKEASLNKGLKASRELLLFK